MSTENNGDDSPQGAALHERAKAAYIDNDYKVARDIYEKLASIGSLQALLFLGDIYLLGNSDVPQDHKMAYYYFERAFNEGKGRLVKPTLMLGQFNMLGIGTPVNHKKAFFYYNKFKDTTIAVGLMRLGLCYLRGQGVEKNMNLAKVYLKRSAKHGHLMARCLYYMVLMRQGNILAFFPWVIANFQAGRIRAANPHDKRVTIWGV